MLVDVDYLRREQMDGPEVYALYLLASIGGIVMLSANDLIVLFLGLETLSISLYVLAASHRRRIESQESGLKYFVLGGFASAVPLYGVALIYGATGTTNLGGIGDVLRDEVLPKGSNTMLLVGIGLLLVGLGFKVAAAPFQFWAPDVYQGAPTPVTAFMASAGKAAAFIALIRVLMVALPPGRRLASGHLGARRAVAHRRCRRRHGADRRQADARLQLGQPRRLHPRSASRPPATSATPNASDGSPRRRCTCCCTRCWSSARSVSSRSCRRR